MTEPNKAMAVNAPPGEPRSLVTPFNRAGALSLLDLGFDAESIVSGDDEMSEAAADMAGFPGERVPHVSFGFEGERWRLRNVAWVVAQSATGARLLDITYRAGYRISFERMAFAGEKLGGLTNFQDRSICLDPRASTEQLVLILVRQLAECASAAAGVPMDFSLTPAAAVLTSRLVMADALAALLQVAYELRSAAALPARARRTAYWDLAAVQYPEPAAAFELHATNDMAVTSGQPAAAVIRLVYRSKTLRAKAEQDTLNLYRNLPPALFKDAKLMTGGFNPSDLAYRFTLPGLKYALGHEPKLQLDEPLNMGVFPESAEILSHLQTTRRNAALRDREVWNLPLVDMTDF